MCPRVKKGIGCEGVRQRERNGACACAHACVCFRRLYTARTRVDFTHIAFHLPMMLPLPYFLALDVERANECLAECGSNLRADRCPPEEDLVALKRQGACAQGDHDEVSKPMILRHRFSTLPPRNRRSDSGKSRLR